MPSGRSIAPAPMRESSDSVRNPCAIVPPNTVCAAAAGSMWMNWRSSVASANASIRAWSIALEQLGVGHHHLLAGERAQAGRLEPDPLDPSGGAVVADRVAALERLVEHDRQRREQIGENALRGEADGDAADAEPGDERGDVD